MEGLKYTEKDLQTLQVTITNTSASTKTINLFDSTGLYNANNSSDGSLQSTPYVRSGGKIQGVFNPVDNLFYTLSINNTDLIAYDSLGNEYLVKAGVGNLKALMIHNDSQNLYYLDNLGELYKLNLITSTLTSSGITDLNAMFINQQLAYVVVSSSINQEIKTVVASSLAVDKTFSISPTELPYGALGLITAIGDTDFSTSSTIVYSDINGNMYSINYDTSISTPISGVVITNYSYNVAQYPYLNYLLIPSGARMYALYLDNSNNITSKSYIYGNNMSSVAVNTLDNSVIVSNIIATGTIYRFSQQNIVNNSTPETINNSSTLVNSFVGFVGSEQSIIATVKSSTTITLTKDMGGLVFANPNAYNFLIRNIRIEPLRVFDIDLVTSTFNQITKIISVNHVDANGTSYQEPKMPINDFSAYQQQQLKVSVPFDKLILDGNTYFKDYEILAGETITFILWYIQETQNLYDNSSLSVMIKNPLSVDVLKNI